MTNLEKSVADHIECGNDALVINTEEQHALPDIVAADEQQQIDALEKQLAVQSLKNETSPVVTKEISDGNDSFNQIEMGSNHSGSSFSAAGDQLVFSDTETSNQTSLYTPYKLQSITTSCFTAGIEEDDIMENEDARFAALSFVAEHRIFMKAALMLLNERDKKAPQLGMLDPIIIKAGPLKKAAHLVNGVWKVKYVEIRRGMFSYYENAVSRDSTGEEELMRKDIPLEASSCTCRPVKLHQKAFNFTPLGALFELSVNGSKRLWMANSRDERHTWMHAIQHAIVGGSVTRGDSIMDGSGDNKKGIDPRSPFRDDLRLFAKSQSKMRNARSMQDYIAELRGILNHSLEVPIKWIARQAIISGGDEMEGAFREETIDLSVDQLWRDLQRDSIKIDGVVYQGDVGHGPERITAALLRRILDVSQTGDAARSLSESQALALARDALLAGNRTRTGGDSYFCIKSLCKNDNLVVIVPKAGEVDPTSLEVCEDNSDNSLHSRLDSKKGWIKTRNLLSRTWKRRFFVLSEGTLSYYEGALPRPHGLKGQMFMKDATIALKHRDHKNELVLSITVNEGTPTLRETLLLFESKNALIDWIYALECTARSKYVTHQRRKSRRRTSLKIPHEELEASCTDIATSAKDATFNHLKVLGIGEEQIISRVDRISRRTSAALKITVKAWTEYKICTVDPEGDESLDTWATVRTDFLQELKMTGGPNGRITRGEETVRVSVLDCIGGSSEPAAASPKRSKSLRLFLRTNGSNEESNSLEFVRAKDALALPSPASEELSDAQTSPIGRNSHPFSSKKIGAGEIGQVLPSAPSIEEEEE
jgi:hypothetical protein